MILDVPLRVGSLFQIGTTGHLPLFPAPMETHPVSWALDLQTNQHFEESASEFTTWGESCRRSKAHNRSLGEQNGLCCVTLSPDHSSDLLTPPPSTGHWYRLSHSKNQNQVEIWHDVSPWYRCKAECHECTYSSVAGNLEVFLGDRSLVGVTVKIACCSERDSKI